MAAPRHREFRGGAMLLITAMWVWAIWSCAEHWRGNPNYSYGWTVPLLALGFGIRRYFMTRNTLDTPKSIALPWPRALLAAFTLAVIGFLLEYSREQVWHPQIVLWSICLIVIASTLAVVRFFFGARLAWAETFPVVFFLTAAPWPPRIEQPITRGLMRAVVTITVELLHWLGIEAQSAGGAIALPSGLVGITEACSGIRSLQAGMMFGLAMGEWFLLVPGRRILLVLAAIGFAFGTNLVRTLALTLMVARYGPDSLDRYHDLIGNVMITALILAIWMTGKALVSRRQLISLTPSAPLLRQSATHGVRLGSPAMAAIALTFVMGLLSARIVSATLEARDHTQKAPFFTARNDSSNNKVAVVPRTVWEELHPSSGEYIRHQNPELPGGGADCFHFFWKPSPWNRFALVHRPDICMPGIGWVSEGAAEPRTVTLDGHELLCYLFRFRRQDVHALELWGAWRNGEPVPINYRPDEVLGTLPAIGSMQLAGKRRSATEIIACNIIAEIRPPPEMAVALLQSVFHYNGDEPIAISKPAHAK